MANRLFTQFTQRLEKGVVTVHAHVAIGATGAPTLQAWNPNTRTYSTAGSAGFAGVKSITRTGAGLYSIVLQDSYQRLLGCEAYFTVAGGTSNVTDVAGNATLTNVNSNSAPTVAICTMSSTATAADPDNGCQMDLEILLHNSASL